MENNSDQLIEESNINPLGHHTNLKGVRLSRIKKEYISDNVIGNSIRNIDFYYNYNIPPQRTSDYCKIHKSGRVQYMGNGRPKCIDLDSELVIYEALEQNPDMSNIELGQLIVDENRKTISRRYLNGRNVSNRELMCDRSISNYIKKFRLEV